MFERFIESFRRLSILRGFWIGLALVGLTIASPAQAQGVTPPGLANAMAAKDANTSSILKIDGVVGIGVGVGSGGAADVVVTTARPGVLGIPTSLDGVAVRVLVTGPFHADAKPTCGNSPLLPPCSNSGGSTTTSTTSILPPPVSIGVSTGTVYECDAGTIGARVQDAGGIVYALSNNHVYARENKGPLGATIVQPGLYDTSCADNGNNHIGTLVYYNTITFDGSPNQVDVALAQSTDLQLGNATLSDGYGAPSSTTKVGALNMLVEKYGRTTNLTHGSIAIVGWSGNVGYTSGTAYFVNQLVVYTATHSPFVKPGDSGSLVVTDDTANNPVGLLFAGDQTGKYGIVNEIQNVLSNLDTYKTGMQIDGK